MISAEILADSLGPNGDRLTTMKIIFPRIVLAEFNTHRMFSRNSASSRAIPFEKMVRMVKGNPFIPLAFQSGHKGMQGAEYLPEDHQTRYCPNTWLRARDAAIEHATYLHKNLNCTKQLVNRLLEPFMWHTVIVTSSEWENFFKLRCPQYRMNVNTSNDDSPEVWKHFRSKSDWLVANSEIWGDASDDHYEKAVGDFDSLDDLEWLKRNDSQAEIHIQAVAEAMWDAMNESEPKKLQPGEWHIPYGERFAEEIIHQIVKNTYPSGAYEYDNLKEQEVKCKIAVARCARLSYETLGDNPEINYEKDLALHDRLAEMQHWSPFEHVARCMTHDEYEEWVRGKGDTIAHDRNYFETSDQIIGWCRNFRGFIQYRSLIDKQ